MRGIEPEAVAVLNAGLHDRAPRQRGTQVIGRHNLLVLPTPVMQPQITELGRVTRGKFEIGEAMRIAVQIGSPGGAGDAERREQFATRQIERAFAGCGGERGGDDVHAAAAIGEVCARRPSLRQVPGERHPVRTLFHFAQQIDARRRATIKAGGHAQEVRKGDAILSGIAPEIPGRNKRSDGLVEISDAMVALGNPDKC